MKNLSAQLRALIDERLQLKKSAAALVKTAEKEERDLNDDETSAVDHAMERMEAIDGEREKLERMERLLGASATPVRREGALAAEDPDDLDDDPYTADVGGQGRRIEVERVKAYTCDTFTRYAIAMVKARNVPSEARRIAKMRWPDHPEVGMVIRATTDPIDTNDAHGTDLLVQTQEAAGEFIELLRPETIVGQIPGMRRLEFNGYGMLKIAKQTGGVSGGYVGEDKSIRVQRLAFGDMSMTPSKLACIVVASNESLDRVNPSLEQLIRDDMVQGTAETIDTTWMSSVPAADNPAGILQGVTPLGGAAIAGAADVPAVTDALKALRMYLRTRNIKFRSPVWIMNSRTHEYLMLQRTTQDTFAWKDEMEGGTLLRTPVAVSNNVNDNVSGGGTNDAYLVLMDANEMFWADDMMPVVDASEHATVEMDDAPATPPDLSGTKHVSLWQQDKTGFRIRMSHTWARRRDEALAFGLVLI